MTVLILLVLPRTCTHCKITRRGIESHDFNRSHPDRPEHKKEVGSNSGQILVQVIPAVVPVTVHTYAQRIRL